MLGLGIPEGNLRRKQQMKIENARIIKRTRPPILQGKTKKETLIKQHQSMAMRGWQIKIT